MNGAGAQEPVHFWSLFVHAQGLSLFCKGLKNMAATTRLELATSAVTVQQPEVTSCNFTAPIATSGALRNPREVLLNPYCTQIRLQQDCHA